MVNIDVKFLRNRFFDEIKEPESYILDSNIVIKLRDLFYSPDKMEDDEIEYWIGLLEFLKEKDVLPGSAIQELSWNFQEYKIEENKFERLGIAIDGLFTYEDSIYNRIRSKGHFNGEINANKGAKRNFESLYENSDANVTMLSTFCIMLKFSYTMLVYDDNKDIYVELCKFLKDELKLVPGYELVFISDLLFSKDVHKAKSIRNMLKLNSKENYMQKIWNSSWDIFFIRAITAFAANTISNKPAADIYNPVLVTRDKNLFEVGEFVNRKAYYQVVKKQVYPGIEFGKDYSEADFLFVRKTHEILASTREKRMKMNYRMSATQRMNRYKVIIRNLENEINQYLNI